MQLQSHGCAASSAARNYVFGMQPGKEDRELKQEERAIR